jgi:hypothetical protein
MHVRALATGAKRLDMSLELHLPVQIRAYIISILLSCQGGRVSANETPDLFTALKADSGLPGSQATPILTDLWRGVACNARARGLRFYF